MPPQVLYTTPLSRKATVIVFKAQMGGRGDAIFQLQIGDQWWAAGGHVDWFREIRQRGQNVGGLPTTHTLEPGEAVTVQGLNGFVDIDLQVSEN
jgi:hypothetical protein